ncbi:MAG: GlxA family transcriptional regulator [Stackebrandtia sp.]
MTGFTATRSHRVAVLVRPGLLPMELGIVHQLFGGAVSASGERLYEVLTCTRTPGSLRTNAEFTVNIDHDTTILDHADTVIVPASDADYAPEDNPEPWLPAALARVRPEARIASICTGAFVLAGAGLLDGRKATTHWISAEDFRRRHPRVKLDPEVLYTQDGRILTSAGEAAGIDLCLHMIRQDHGAAIANDIARRTVVPPHREGGQAQYIRHPLPEPQRSSTRNARQWALRRLHRPLSLRELAEHESMSPRNFTRRFRQETGVSVGQWLAERRLDRARQLLEETDTPIDRVAAEVGFGTGTSLRQHFRTALGVSPRAYRQTFRG